MFWRKKKPKYQTTQITDANFNELVAQSKIPVLLDFYADWCGPCKILGPIIKSIPTLMFVNKGELVERYQGMIPKPNLEEILEEYIAEG